MHPATMHRGLAKWLSAISLASPLIALTATAHGQAVDGSFRLSLEGNFASFEKIKLKESGFEDFEARETSFGILGSGLGVGLGYGASDSVVLGVRILQGTVRREYDDDFIEPDKGNVFSIIPSLEILTNSGEKARPFFLFAAGVRTGSTESDGVETSKFTTGIFGAGFGVHAFVTPTFSIDPGLTVFGVRGSDEVGGSEFDRSGVAVIASFGLSGWVGGTLPKSEAAETRGLARDDRSDAHDGDDAVHADSTAGGSDARIDRGAITGRFAAGSTSIGLLGRPRESTSVVGIKVSLRGSARALRNCDEAAIVIGEKRFPLKGIKYSVGHGGFSAVGLLKAKVELSALEALGESRGDAMVVICDKRLAVHPSDRERVYEFVEKFHERVATYEKRRRKNNEAPTGEPNVDDVNEDDAPDGNDDAPNTGEPPKDDNSDEGNGNENAETPEAGGETP